MSETSVKGERRVRPCCFRQLRWSLVVLAALCSQAGSQIQLQSAFPNLSFTRPVDIQAPPDSSNHLVVVAQQGIIYIFPNSTSVQSAKVFLDIRDSVQSIGNEEGLLGLAFHPDFKNNRHIFVNHTGKNPRRDVVARYTVSATNPDSAVKSRRVSIFEIYDP